MRRSIPLLILLTCQHADAQKPAAAPPILVLDSGGHTSVVWKMLFTPDGKELISVSNDKTIRFWDGRTLAVGGWGLNGARGSIYLISTVTGRIERVLKGHTSSIQSLSFAAAPGGPLLLASGSNDNTARIWDVTTGECQRFLKGHTDVVVGVAFAPDGSRLATASYDKTARIWSVADGRCLRTLQGHTKEVRCVDWSPNGALLATGGWDRSIKIWGPEGALSRTIENLDNDVVSVRFNAADSSELLYTWGGLKRRAGAAVLRVSSGQERVRFTKHDNTVYSGAISPDGTMAATAGGDFHEIYLWRLTDAAALHRMAGKGKPNWSAGWSPDGKRIAWGNTFKYTPDNDWGPLERSFSLAELECGPSPDGGYRRAREFRGSLSLHLNGPTSLEVKQQDAVVAKIAPTHNQTIRCFSFVTDDRIVVGTGSGLFLCDARTGARIRVFQGHTGWVCAVAPSPDGRFLLSASKDQTLRIWDPDRDEPLLSLFVAGDDWIAWTPEGYYAASPGGENLMGWQVSNGPEQVGTFAPASQFHKSLYRPDVIKLAFETGSVATALERLKEPVKFVTDVIPPLVVITSPGDPRKRVENPELTVRAKARAQTGHPIRYFRLLLDDRPYEGDQGRKEVVGDLAGIEEKSQAWHVRLDPGRHRLAVIAESDVSAGRSETIEVIYDEQRVEPPRLYALLVGVAEYEDDSLKLKYAADDARLLEKVLRDNTAKAFAGVPPEIKCFIDANATKASFIEGLKWLKNSMKSQDVGIIFFSGHGYRDDEGLFYMLPAEVKSQSIEATALDGALFKSKLAGIKGTLVVMLDACHAGAVDKGVEGARQLRPITDDFARDMVRDGSGIVMMCSSTGKEVSIEDPQLGQGYFTKVLTDGLKGGADNNKDGSVTLTELDDYLSEQVKKLSKNRQHPVTAKPTSVQSFVLSRP